jgi:catechol 2,3-dioxygenase-like lactoylglutathione lyase family enzyme
MGLSEQPSLQVSKDLLQQRFKIGGHVLKVLRSGKPPEAEPSGIDKAIGMRLLAFIVDDFDELLGRLDAAGHRHSSLPVPDKLGYRVAFTKDPEGTVLELVGLKKPGGPALRARLQVGLTVTDVERSRHFYGEQLGLPEEPVMKLSGSGTQVSERYGFTWGASTIKFWQLPGERPVHTGALAQRAGVRYFTAMVEDLDAAHAELVAKDVPVRMPPRELPGLAKIMFIADPDDNWIELAQRL